LAEPDADHDVAALTALAGGRTRLYRLIDLIGRWSNIDLFMISLLVAMVQFGT
jgi:uncharacterized paraquat-inducible protein A